MQVIRDDPPMPEEIANGFYPAFEDGWRGAETVGRLAMLVFVLAAALGLFGHGLFSRRTLANPDRSLEIGYEPVVRFGAPTTVALDTRVPPGGDKVAVTMSADLVDHFGLETITPRPATWEAGGNGTRLVFPVLQGQDRVFIRFAGNPNFRGKVRLWARLDAGETVSWTQYSVP